jgi:hypothetical protein
MRTERHPTFLAVVWRSGIAAPEDRLPYRVELEGHFLVQWADTPFRTDDGVGFGFRASMPVWELGPIRDFNDHLAISFGMVWAHLGGCRPERRDCAADDFWFPVVMPWSGFLTCSRSLFPDIGLAIHRASWSWYDGPPGPPGRRLDSDTRVAFVSWLGMRFSPSTLFSVVRRLGVPSTTAGVSLRFWATALRAAGGAWSR